MKRRFTVVLPGILYAAVLIGLLLLQSKAIESTGDRLTANLAALFLVIPAVFLLKFYLKRNETQEEEKGTESAAGNFEETINLEQKKHPEEIREEFYAQMEQFGLSAREQEAAWLLYRGYTNRQIAEELYISEATVKKHVGHIYEKTKLTGRKEFREKIKEQISAEFGR